MARWNSKTIRSAVAALRPDLIFEDQPGEDFTANGFSVALDPNFEDALHVRGFVTGDSMIPAHDDVEVEMVEVTSGFSGGGLRSANPEVIQLYADIRKILVGQGFEIVDSMDPYF